MEAASHAAGTIWSICVDSPPDVKSTLATTSTIRALIQLLSVQNVEAQVIPIAQLPPWNHLSEQNILSHEKIVRKEHSHSLPCCV